MMKTSDNPLPFELDEGEKILWTLHKPQPPGSMKLRILLWCVAVVLGILALVLLSSDFALAFVLGVVALLCVSGAEHSYTNAPHRISYVLSNRRAFIIETPVKRGKPATIITFRVRRNMVGRVLRRSSGHVDYHLGREVMEEEEDLPRGFINLAPEQDPAPVLTQLGVELPAEGETRKLPGFSYPREEEYRRPGYNLILAVLALAACLFCLDTQGSSLLLSGQETTATILSYEQGKETRGRKWTRRTVTTHHPLLAFNTPDGQTHKVQSIYGFDDEPKYPAGSQVTALYAPADPGCATIKDYGILRAPAFMLLAFLFFLVRYLRAPRNKKPGYVLIKC